MKNDKLSSIYKAHFHLPGLFEFPEFYEKFLLLYKTHPEYFYDWCDIGSIYGAPGDCIWGGGRAGFGQDHIEEKILLLSRQYGFSVRFTFSNSLLETRHLEDVKCNDLCRKFHDEKNGIIVHSDLLLKYLLEKYPDYYFVSSTTKVLEDFNDFKNELGRTEFSYVVPDFRLNRNFAELEKLSREEKSKVEFLCNECCWFECSSRKKCYEYVSRKTLGIDVPDWRCSSPESGVGYVFSKAMENPGFISVEDIQEIYLPMGFSNFKIEGRSLGSALVFEMLLYYMVKSEFHLKAREKIYLDNTLDLF